MIASCGVYKTSLAISHLPEPAAVHRNRCQNVYTRRLALGFERAARTISSPDEETSLAITFALQEAASASEHNPVPHPTSSTVIAANALLLTVSHSDNVIELSQRRVA